MAQADINPIDGEEEDDGFISIRDLIDPALQGLTTTQLRQQRMEMVSDTLQPGTLPSRLYQTNPFVHPVEPTEMGEVPYQLSALELPPTAEEIGRIAEDEAEDEAMTQAIEDMLATTSMLNRGM